MTTYELVQKLKREVRTKEDLPEYFFVTENIDGKEEIIEIHTPEVVATREMRMWGNPNTDGDGYLWDFDPK